MPTTRRPRRHAARPRVSPEAVALFRRLEGTPPRLRHGCEFTDAEKRLCRALGLDWLSMKSPVTVHSPNPDHVEGSYQAQCWREAWAWRCALVEAAMKEAGR
jgi:hypothetical protein